MMNVNGTSRLAALLGTTLLIAGCHRGAPGGQVLARVNGDEITQTDLNAEFAVAGVPASARAKAGPELLQQIVERKLLVQAATKDGVDKDPDFVVLRRRGDEIMLAQKFVQRQSQNAREQPSGDQIETYLRAHPALAENRQILTFDQVRFPSPADVAEARALKAAETMEALVAVLRARGVQFQREVVRSDTATLPDPILASVDKLKPGQPLVIVGGPTLIAAALTSREPAPPTSSAQATELAKNRLTMETVTNRVKQESVALRQAAKIDYAKGMAPPPPASDPARR